MDPTESAKTFSTLQPFLFWLVAGLTGACAIGTVVSQNIVRSATWLLFTLAGVSAVFFLLGADIVGAIQLLVYVGGTLVLVVFGVMLTAQGPFISMKASGAEWAISVVAGLMLLSVLGISVVSPSGLRLPRNMETQEPVAVYRPDRPHAPHLRSLPRESKDGKDSEGKAKGPELKAGAPGPKGKGAKGDDQPKAKQKGDQPKAKGGQPKAKQKDEQPKAKQEEDQPAPPPVAKAEPAAPLDPATSVNSALLGQGFSGVGVGPAHGERNRTDVVDAKTGRRAEPKIVRTSYLLPFELVSVHLLVVLIGAAYLARAKRRREALP